HSARA
ncbi:mutT/nudix family protein, partial [Vibrio parahaemolyticus AQ3810]